MKRKAYTIAEAMVTMAIIGIVASLTIPTFVAAYRKHVYANSLATAVANFETGMTTMMAKDGVDDLLDTEAWSKIKSGTNYSLTNNSSNTVIENFMKEIRKTLVLEGYNKTLTKYRALQVPEMAPWVTYGSVIRFNARNGVEYMIEVSNVSEAREKSELEVLAQGTNLQNVAARVLIDVNGDSLPNIIGRDLFWYELGTDGRLYPHYGKDFCAFSGNSCGVPKTKCVIEKDGEYCSAYLKENGYKMDY